jgi:hypothetical protein
VTWKEQPLPEDVGAIKNVYFATATDGWAVGQRIGGGPVIGRHKGRRQGVGAAGGSPGHPISDPDSLSRRPRGLGHRRQRAVRRVRNSDHGWRRELDEAEAGLYLDSLQNVRCTSPGGGWVVGSRVIPMKGREPRYSAFESALLHNDGGATDWRDVRMLDGVGELNAAHFVNAENGWAVATDPDGTWGVR